MDKYHQEIFREIKELAKGKVRNAWVDSYLGTKDEHYGLSVPQIRKVAKDFVKTHKTLNFDEYTKLLNSLYLGKSFEEKTITGYFLEYYPKLRKQLDLKLLDSWLDELVGWAEIDCTCQNKFSYDEILENWEEWKKLLIKFNQDKNISKKRASLVLLVGPAAYSEDKRLGSLAFENIDKLKSEKDILITKAISWLLRSLIKNYKKEVGEYLEKNKNELPKIAIRETQRKLSTGKK